MNAEETEICEFLKKRGDMFVSCTDISKAVGRGRQFQQDRNWARPTLRRMEIDGILEANPYGEYRLKRSADAEPEPQPAPKAEPEPDPEQFIDFKRALSNPAASLGDTTIIRLEDV